jgi:uncharacterized protein YtpQ (UPF0354 family)
MQKTLLTNAFFGLILCSLVAHCQSKSHLLTPMEFCKVYQDSLSRRLPGIKFNQVDERTFTTQKDSFMIQSSIDNAYKEYSSQPDSLGAILKRYTASCLDAIGMKTSPTDAGNLIPMIKPLSYLDELKRMASEMGAKKQTEYVYEKYNADLMIFYALNTENNIEYLTGDEFKKLNLPHDSLRPVAIRNLANILPDVKQNGGDGLYMITAGGNFEACLILMDWIWNKQRMPVKGDYVIGVPARDMLLITGTEDKAHLDKLRALTKKSYQDGDHAISDKLYRWDGNKLVPFE